MQLVEEKTAALLAHPAFNYVVHQMATTMTAVQTTAPKLASLFSTQQRWLMSQLAVSIYFSSVATGSPGMSRRDLVEAVVENGLASRNTATAFFSEALYYGTIQPTTTIPALKHVAEPSPAAWTIFGKWYALHLGALDALDGGTRAAHFEEAGQSLLAAIHVPMVEKLLASAPIRAPSPSYAVFASVDEGGSLMDRLVAGVAGGAAFEQDRALTNITSVSALAHALNLSRTHAGRTLAAAAAIKALGWSGTRGRSPLWVSREFLTDYATIQAIKLAIIDVAYAENRKVLVSA